MTSDEILNKLPYTFPFLFVDEIDMVDEQSLTGHYTFDPGHSFYQGHFKDRPVTPGVILSETMAQIGLACFGIYLTRNENLPPQASIAMTSMAIDFLIPVFPGEKVKVVSEKIYFRFNKLKCAVKMWNEADQEVCNGTIAGYLIHK